MIKLISIIILIISLSIPVSAETNFCHDKTTWNDWNKMVKSNPEDIPLQIMHALRIGLCIKIEQNSISFEEATDLFDAMFDDVMKKRDQENKSKDKEHL